MKALFLSARRCTKLGLALAGWAAGSFAWAIPFPTLSVSYTSASTAAVPMSPAVLVMLAALLGLFFVLRAKSRLGRLWGLVAAGGLLVLMFTWPVREGVAMAPPTSLNLSQGNPASVLGSAGTWTVTNDLASSATIQQVSVSPAQNYQLANNNCMGMTLNPGQSCTVAVQVIP